VADSAPVTCLLVDDLEENLLALESLLERDGVEILKAQSGSAALELLLRHEVALALVDVQMPEMDGFELAELMRGNRRTSHVPIIFVTAGSRDLSHVFQGYDAGAVDFLFKPVEPQILKNKAETFFRLHEQRQELARQVEVIRQAHADRERLTRELEETLRFNETFVALVGHDLRNPLNAILMGVELLKKQAPDATLGKTIGQIRASGQRMRNMLDDLADLARARLGGGIAVVREPADALALSRRVVAEQQASHPGRSIELSASGNTLGSWDGGRVQQILANLLGNALRHGAPGEPVSVTVDGSAGDAVLVTVHNQGHIPEELLPHLFHPFSSGQRHRARADGLGLGLFIVRQLALAHDGDVSVESSKEFGTRFQVRLPRSATADPGPASLVSDPSAAPT
jgi:two-component system sensor histidine kinase/response regulator